MLYFDVDSPRLELMYLSNTILLDGRDMYWVYYIKYNYMFRRLTMAIFSLYMIVDLPFLRLAVQFHFTMYKCPLQFSASKHFPIFNFGHIFHFSLFLCTFHSNFFTSFLCLSTVRQRVTLLDLLLKWILSFYITIAWIMLYKSLF